jgi:hypothetical protein
VRPPRYHVVDTPERGPVSVKTDTRGEYETMEWLQAVDPEIAQAIRWEAERQGRNRERIASEDVVSEAVLEAVDSVLTT